MAKHCVLDAFSAYRLSGEPIPDDVTILLKHADELAEHFGIELNWKKDWAPWSDTSYLTKSDRQDPDVMANVRAIADVCGMIAFIAANEDDDYVGYWRGPGMRPVADSPLVQFDNEGQFTLCGISFAEAILYQTSSEEGFAEMRDWFRSLGIEVRAERIGDLVCQSDDPGPDKLHHELYDRYLSR
jgi:hypothetical protein